MNARPTVVLAGPPGSGKSTVAKVLARMTGMTVRDTDADVEATAGKRISDIFVDDGEPAFRDLEVAAVAAALSSKISNDGAGTGTNTGAGASADNGPGVIVSLGGGAVLHPITQANLEDYRAHGGLVVFLDVTLAFAAPRVGFNQARPLLLGNPRAQWKALMDERRPTYEAVSNLTVLTDNKTPEDVAAEIIAALNQRDQTNGTSA